MSRASWEQHAGTADARRSRDAGHGELNPTRRCHQIAKRTLLFAACSACASAQRAVSARSATITTFPAMDEFRARRVADALRDRGVNAHLLRAGLGQFGVRVSLPGGREAEWDTDGTAGLEAQVMRDGMLVGYVPQIEGSEDFSEPQIVDAIARTDYDQPIARQRTAAAPLGPALTREGGVFRRFLDGFRYQ